MPSGLSALPAVLFLFLAEPAGEEIYTWTDAEGVAHYTNDPNTVPRRYRDKARSLDGQALPADGATKPSPPADTKATAPEESPKQPAAKPAERSDEPLDESAPAPAPIPTGGTPLDEAGWRRLFQRATERVRRAELTLARDREALNRVSSEEGYLVVDPYGRVMTAGRATALRLQVTEDERVLHDAREALYDLERAAAREAIPLEWRR